MSPTSTDSKKDGLNILIVTESYPPESYGGGEISCALLAGSLAERENVSVTVLTSQIEGEKESEVKDGVRIIRKLKTGIDRSSLKGNLQRKIYFKRSVRKEVGKLSHDHDFIHFFNITSMTDIGTEKPTFATINSYINFCPKGNLFYKEESVCEGCGFRKFIGCITRSSYVGNQEISGVLKYNPVFWLALYLDYKKRYRSLRHVDNFFSLSGFINDLLIRAGVNKENIEKVVNIPDISKEDGLDETIETTFEEAEKPILTYIGVLSNIKGVDLLIDAFNDVRSNATLIIVGEGPERNRLEEMAGPDIEFAGHVDHDILHTVYRRSDAIIVPSLWPEPLSRVLLEAAYFGKPVLATAVGGSPEVIKDGYNGLLAEPEVEDINQKLNYMIERGEKRKKMAENMKRFYRKRLSKEKVIDRIIDFYEESMR